MRALIKNVPIRYHCVDVIITIIIVIFILGLQVLAYITYFYYVEL